MVSVVLKVLTINFNDCGTIFLTIRRNNLMDHRCWIIFKDRDKVLMWQLMVIKVSSDRDLETDIKRNRVIRNRTVFALETYPVLLMGVSGVVG